MDTITRTAARVSAPIAGTSITARSPRGWVRVGASSSSATARSDHAVIKANRLWAEQIILMGRHDDRIKLAREFGATNIVSERGDEAIARCAS
jgi:hypothetical protein